MRYGRYLSIIVLAAFVFPGCTKNKLMKTSTETLCSRMWSCYTVTDNGQVSTVDCMYSDELTFNTNGKGNRHFVIKCATTDPENLTLQWSLSTDAQTLSVGNFEGSNNKVTQMKVVTLSKTALEVEYTNMAGHVIHSEYKAL